MSFPRRHSEWSGPENLVKRTSKVLDPHIRFAKSAGLMENVKKINLYKGGKYPGESTTKHGKSISIRGTEPPKVLEHVFYHELGHKVLHKVDSWKMPQSEINRTEKEAEKFAKHWKSKSRKVI